MIKNIISVLLLVLAMQQSAVGETRRIVEQANQFGGKTIELDYSTDNLEFKLSRVVEYLDSSGRLRMVVGFRKNNQYNPLKIEKAIERYTAAGQLESVEIDLLPEKAFETGYNKTITYYDQEGRKSHQEFFYNRSDFDSQVYRKSIDYFNLTGERTRSEFYLTDAEVEKTGYFKLITYYKDGKITHQEMIDKSGISF